MTSWARFLTLRRDLYISPAILIFDILP
jgi:hypothetical protein